MGLVEVLAQVRTRPHFPGNHVFGVPVKGQQLGIVLVYEPAPDFSKFVPVFIGCGKVQVDMGMGSPPGLELCHPEIGQEGESSSCTGEKCVQVSFELSAIDGPVVVICAAELRTQQV